jgi:hypothetical protein
MESSMRHLLTILRPKPSPFPLIRIGGKRDGAYLVPNDLEGIAACFSPGVSNIKKFEDQLVNNHGIRCHLCDFSVSPDQLSTPLIEGKQTFEKLWLEAEDTDTSVTLETWVARHSPNRSEDLILQMDIEGAEYRTLAACPAETLDRFRIIVIELHDLNAFNDPNLAATTIGPLLEALDRSHRCIHVHPNNCCGQILHTETGMNIPLGVEATFLRKDRFDESPHAKTFQPQLPHPLDITSNIGLAAPALHLNTAWIEGGKRSPASRLKMLYDLYVFPVKARTNHAIARSLTKALQLFKP